MSYSPPCGNNNNFNQDWLRLEYVTTCVGFDDLLDITLARNIAQVDTAIVVTTHEDKKTAKCVRKHGATLVQTDLFKKDGRNFNKGAAINNGFDYFRFYGWRVFMDSDILLPSGFRHRLFNYEHLNPGCLYGIDRMDINGEHAIRRFLADNRRQHTHSCLLGPTHGSFAHRYVHKLNGPCVLGFFSMWNARTQKDYPHSLGGAQHDDIAWSNLWPKAMRRHLTSSIAYHLHPGGKPKIGENWDGHRRMPRLK